jgi:hypothetical protein
VVRGLPPIGKVPDRAVIGMSLMRDVLILPFDLQAGLELELGRREMFITSLLGCLAAVPGLPISQTAQRQWSPAIKWSVKRVC